MASARPKVRISSGVSRDRPVSPWLVLSLEVSPDVPRSPEVPDELDVDSEVDFEVVFVLTVALPRLSLTYLAVSRSRTLQNHLYPQLLRIVPLALL